MILSLYMAPQPILYQDVTLRIASERGRELFVNFCVKTSRRIQGTLVTSTNRLTARLATAPSAGGPCPAWGRTKRSGTPRQARVAQRRTARNQACFPPHYVS